jgi:hypothetical protein
LRRDRLQRFDQRRVQLARLGFRVKELLGGLDWWRRDGHPIEISDQPGTLCAEAAD